MRKRGREGGRGERVKREWRARVVINSRRRGAKRDEKNCIVHGVFFLRNIF